MFTDPVLSRLENCRRLSLQYLYIQHSKRLGTSHTCQRSVFQAISQNCHS